MLVVVECLERLVEVVADRQGDLGGGRDVPTLRNVNLEIERGEWKSYRIKYVHPVESGTLTGYLTAIGDDRFLDVMPARGEDRAVKGEVVVVAGVDVDATPRVLTIDVTSVPDAAMPAIMLTSGVGTNLMTEPSFANPIASRMTPAMNVATVRPWMPYFWTMP